MALSTLRGEALAPYLPSFVENPCGFDSAEDYIRRMCPIILDEKWLSFYYHKRPVKDQNEEGGETGWGPLPYPKFYATIASKYGVDEKTIRGRVALVMTMETLEEGFIASDDPEARQQAFDGLFEWASVEFSSFLTVLPVRSIRSYERWKHGSASMYGEYSGAGWWRPETLHAMLNPPPPASGPTGGKPVVLVMWCDAPCPMQELCEAFETAVIKHWMGRLLPLMGNDIGFGLETHSTHPLCTWMKVLSRHCDRGVYLSLLVERIFDEHAENKKKKKTRTKMATEKKKKKNKAVNEDIPPAAGLVRFTRDLLNADATPVPARGSSSSSGSPPFIRVPTPIPSPRMLAMYNEVEEDHGDTETLQQRMAAMEEEIQQKLEWSRLMFWDLVVIIVALLLSMAASNKLPRFSFLG